MRTNLLMLGLLCVMGCGGPIAPADARLDSALSLELREVYAGASMVSFAIVGAGGAWRRAFNVPITRAELSFFTRETSATLETLELLLPDSRTPAQLYPPDGLSLRNLSLGVGRPTQMSIDARSAASLTLSTRTPLTLHWGLGLEGGKVHPLGDVTTLPIDLNIAVDKSDGALTATVTAACAGKCWELDGILSFEDISLMLDADVAPR